MNDEEERARDLANVLFLLDQLREIRPFFLKYMKDNQDDVLPALSAWMVCFESSIPYTNDPEAARQAVALATGRFCDSFKKFTDRHNG